VSRRAFELTALPSYGKLYTVDKLGNVWGGRPVLYVNTEIDNLKNAVVKVCITR
jgi:aminopeptidase C